MNITIGVRARKREDSFELLKRLGVPFRTQETEEKRSARMSAPAATMETGS